MSQLTKKKSGIETLKNKRKSSSSPETKKRKTKKSDFEFNVENSFGWSKFYQDRARLVKLYCQLKKNPDQQWPFQNKILAVVFLTNVPHTKIGASEYQTKTYVFANQYEEDYPNRSRTKFLRQLEENGCKLNSKFDIATNTDWKFILNAIKSSRFYKPSMDLKDAFKQGQEVQVDVREKPHLCRLYSALRDTLETGFGNHVTKDLITLLFHKIIIPALKLSTNDIGFSAFSSDSNKLISEVQFQDSDDFELYSVLSPTSVKNSSSHIVKGGSRLSRGISSGSNSCSKRTLPGSRESRTSDLYLPPESTVLRRFMTIRKVVCPDFSVYLRFTPGYFLLTFEFDKKQVSIPVVVSRCISQLLTQMHFQEHAFGIVLTPVKFIVIYLKKDSSLGRGMISIFTYERALFKKVAGSYVLDCNGLTELINWICCIVELGKRPSEMFPEIEF